MNITKQVVDDVNIVLSLEIEKADYADAVEKQIKETRKKVQMHGFRKGMVPAGLVRKMYGNQITVDEVNKLINDSMYKYIAENKLNVLGEPMINEKQEAVDFMNTEKFTVSFDIAIAPEFELTLNDTVKVPYYTITVSDEMVEGQVKGYQGQFGENVDAEEAVEEDIVKGNIAELDAEGNIVEGGLSADDATIYVKYIKNDDEKAKFVGAKKYASVDFNLAAAYDGNKSEMASILQVKAEELGDVTANFRFTINEIKHHEAALLNEELFQKVFGDACTTEEQFREAIKGQIAEQLAQNSEYKFNMDARKMLMEQVGQLTFPEQSLKKWLLAKDENRDEAKLNEDFPKMMEDLTWQLIEEKIVEANEIKVNEEDIKAEAAAMIQAQMAQYGMANIPMEYMKQYIDSIMKDEKQRGQMRDNAVTRKIFAAIRQAVSLDNQECTIEEFQKMLA